MIRRIAQIFHLSPQFNWQRYRNGIVVVVAILFVVISINTIARMISTLRDKEIYDVELWVKAMESMNHTSTRGNIINNIDLANARQNIPFILLGEDMRVVASHLVDSDIVEHPDRLRRYLRDFSRENEPIEIVNLWGERYYLLYGTSRLLRQLSYVPFILPLILFFFFVIAYIALRSTKRGEQDRVWVGLAKETAHQLGTPISSLMGWVEYLREQGVEEDAVDEMERDLAHLMKVTDRFSKIGADTPLVAASVNEVIEGVVHYFRGRMPRGVSLVYDGLSMAPATVNLNITLFEWVIENLLKNSLDALQGSGAITVSLVADDHQVTIDVRDTGRGIAKGQWRKIFEPGFTTKSRGWGLGLSLSRRIIEEYHSGRIGVVASEVGRGTTIRITLNRVFDL